MDKEKPALVRRVGATARQAANAALMGLAKGMGSALGAAIVAGVLWWLGVR
ncbi:hypothetical protein [Amycolatopsis sp. 195334CR]|uniref:hypothetical protein n=1 Tax=Amycolatopsis sp. 195334CR TaxID=2814588 RepID=UPI001A8F9CBF|nr:hypothetical protein [Amycolatopsis sp. 195334CR]MBN6034037.1 hypothetical protein [Amycolatopsis sp. 195334CR]